MRKLILNRKNNALFQTKIRQLSGHRSTKILVLDLRNDGNRPSLTSSVIAEERQGVSSKNTMNEMADAITGGNDIGPWALWSGNILGKNAGILVEI